MNATRKRRRGRDPLYVFKVEEEKRPRHPSLEERGRADASGYDCPSVSSVNYHYLTNASER